MRTKLEVAHDISSIGTCVLTIVIVALMVIPMLWPSQAPQSVVTPVGKPMTGWLMPSILAGCLLLAGALNLLAARERRRPSLVHPQALQRMPVPFTPSPPDLFATVPTLKEKIFLGPDITPQFLVDLYKDHTAIQTEKLLAIYVGKWMRLPGAISDVNKVNDELSMVSFSGNPLSGVPSVHMVFGNKWLDQLSILRPGNNITVEGQIKRVESTSIHLYDCNLV